MSAEIYKFPGSEEIENVSAQIVASSANKANALLTSEDDIKRERLKRLNKLFFPGKEIKIFSFNDNNGINFQIGDRWRVFNGILKSKIRLRELKKLLLQYIINNMPSVLIDDITNLTIESDRIIFLISGDKKQHYINI